MSGITITKRATVAIAMTSTIAISSCGGGGTSSSVKLAQTRVTRSQQAVADAQKALDNANKAFCTNAGTYITAIDRYAKVFDKSAATVADLKTAGSDLAKPQQATASSVQTVFDSRDALAKAEQELAAAQSDLATAQAAASGQTTTTTSSSSSTTSTTLVSGATANRVQQAEADFTAATQNVSDQTPLLQATATLNSAAVALQMAWLRAFAEAGCLTDEQHKQAEAAVHEYTVALQTALQTTGYYSGGIDGVYGPSTADAVKQLQSDNGLPATGFVDRATALALSTAMAAKGTAVASKSVAHTAAVQSTLKLVGFWTGPVDGRWTPELTDALKNFQTHLGVPATGSVDAATLAALDAAIGNATSPPPSAAPTTAANGTTTTT